MPEGKLRVSDAPGAEAHVHATDLQRLMETLLETLANIDFENQRRKEKLRRSATDPTLKTMLLSRCEKDHRERRAPYVRELKALAERIRNVDGDRA